MVGNWFQVSHFLTPVKIRGRQFGRHTDYVFKVMGSKDVCNSGGIHFDGVLSRLSGLNFNLIRLYDKFNNQQLTAMTTFSLENRAYSAVTHNKQPATIRYTAYNIHVAFSIFAGNLVDAFITMTG